MVLLQGHVDKAPASLESTQTTLDNQQGKPNREPPVYTSFKVYPTSSHPILAPTPRIGALHTSSGRIASLPAIAQWPPQTNPSSISTLTTYHASAEGPSRHVATVPGMLPGIYSISYSYDDSILTRPIGEQSVLAVTAGDLTYSPVSIAIPPLGLLPFNQVPIAQLPQPQQTQHQALQRHPPLAP